MRRRILWPALVAGMGIPGSARADERPASLPAASQASGQLVEGIVLTHLGRGIDAARVRIESLQAGADDEPLAAGETNETGDFAIRLPRPASGPVRVRIQMEGYVDFVEEVDPTDPDEPPFVEAVLEGGARLSGNVLAEGTGRRIGGARVRCESGGRHMATVTDDHGAFTFQNVFRGPAVVTAEAEGFGAERRTVRIAADHAVIEIRLRPQRLVELTVQTTKGDPAPEVLVEAYVEPTQHFLSAMTDKTGKVLLRGISADGEILHVRLSGKGYVPTLGFSEEVDLEDEEPSTQPAASAPGTQAPGTQAAVLKRRIVIAIAAFARGTVVDARTGEPIVGVRVIAGREVRGNMPMVWTSLAGTYELHGLPPGDNVLSFQHADYATAIEERSLSRGQPTTIDVRLERGAPIGGVVQDGDGQPLDQVRVSADDWKGYRTLGLRTITGEDGKFLFPHAPEGEITFSFVRPGFGPPTAHTLTAGRTDYRIVFEAPAAPETLAGLTEKVPTGSPVPDLTLTAIDGTEYKLSRLRGKYVFIDCWASWCAPCIKEIPHIRKLHEATKGRADFLLIGVSLDTDREALKRAVTEHGITWPQVFGPDSGAEEAFQTLDGIAIPYTCLIGPDGTLLAQRLRGPDLVETVKTHLPK